MKNIYNFLIATLCIPVLAGCGESASTTIPGPEPGTGTGGENTEGRLYPIEFRCISDGNAGTRALSDFPNDRRIGVVAARYASPVVWTSYGDIEDAGATAVTESSGIYGFRWDVQKYWPFDGSDLVFLAYSPAASDHPATVQLNPGNASLSLTLQADMPDVMYASANKDAEDIPYNKLSGPVDLGTFMHALSQLTVNLIADQTMNPAVRVTSLAVSTQRRTATLDLLEGENGLTVSTGEDFTYTLVNQPQRFDQQALGYTVLLYPETEGDTQLHITLTDGPFSVTKVYPITAFKNADEQGGDISLYRGKNTVLNITVKSTEIEEPEENLVLQGVVSDWKDKGDFGVIIN